MTNTNDTTTDLYERALAAEPRLRALDLAVRTMAALVRPGDMMCPGCVWEQVIKPLARPLIGNERGTVPANAKDPADSWDPVNLADLLGTLDEARERRVPADTETERWLRTDEAYDAVTDTWLHLIEQAGQADGHGIGPAGRNLLVRH
ncbi:hypothetical protein [Rhodococcus phenolicus]|uniref:hypothetical protein n=1 Tax=Rhodococcus phenolicus TaxID=263849 RepID=UPI00082A4D5C|nr:hypothetical protein [Rhodococcus phenolicus]